MAYIVGLLRTRLIEAISAISRRIERRYLPPPRIDPRRRIGAVLIQIHSAVEPDRIRRDEPPDIRIIVAEGVVVQPGIPVQVLALVTQVLFDRFGVLGGIERDRPAVEVGGLPVLLARVAPRPVCGTPACRGRPETGSNVTT